jgi:Ca2+-transporting ATPase
MPDTTDILSGLDSAEAQRRLRDAGWNELPAARPRSLLAIAWTVVREPMFLLLIGCGSIYLALGSRADASILLGSVVIVMALSFFQERKSERALEALRDLSSPRALVLRDGQPRRIPGREVVPGDLVMLAEGDRVPADACLVAGQGMSTDESLLSGEAVAVRKLAVAAPPAQFAPPGGDDHPFLYSGSLVVQGKGTALVLATGERTMLGRIGKALSSLEEQPSLLQSETARAVRVVAVSSIALVIALALWYGSTRGDWLNGILAGLTLAMGLLPAELPLILTIFLGLGAWRMAGQRVLTRRIAAIETLGAASVLCVDKTGTLTQNRMALAQVVAGELVHAFADGAAPTPAGFAEAFHETLEFAMLSSHRDPFDPMELAILHAGRAALAGTEHIHSGWKLVDEYPLSAELLAMSRVWRSPDLVDYVIAAKGAPEAIVDLCHLEPEQTQRIGAQVNRAAAQGLRVLAVAKASFRQQALPAIQHDFDFRFVGLVALADPLRPSVPPAIAQCHAAGIRVIMITGDYPATALSIAAQAGLDTQGGVLAGADIDALADPLLRQRLAEVNVCCRVQPEQKLRLVQALRDGGAIVAMTGDGVNDAPALKAAHIGIAMGARGTDVAREAAALVLLDDDFGAIVAAVAMGRRIVDNIRKAVVFIVAAHIPIAGMSILPVVMGWPLILLPVHIVFFELMIDPTCSIVFEAERAEADVMQRPPRPAAEPIFNRPLLMRGVRQGCVLLAILTGVYLAAQAAGLALGQTRALTFSAMIVGDIWLIFINRSWSASARAALMRPNPALWLVVGCALLMLGLALFLPVMRTLFHFGTPAPSHLLFTMAAVSGILLLFNTITSTRVR